MIDATLGIDVGTTAVKAAIVTVDGRLVGHADQTYPVHHPGPGLAEQDPADWWKGVVSSVARAREMAGPDVWIRAVGAAGQGCGMVAIDEQMRPLRPALIWMDTRAAAEAEQMSAAVGEDVRAANGAGIAPFNVEPKMMWMRKHEPELFARARWFVTPTTWITTQLCGRAVANHSDAGILFAYDLRMNAWSNAVLEGIGIEPSYYPELAHGDEVVGTITAAAAAALGLDPDVVVVAGAGDTPAAALSAGITEPGDSYLAMGTAAVIGICGDKAVFQPKLLTHPYVLPGLVFTSGSMTSFGASLRWVNRTLGIGEESSATFATMLTEAGTAAPGAGGLVFLPYLSGELHPILDPRARGVWFGLSQATTRADLLRAVLEGGAFAIRDNLCAAKEVGLRPQEISAAGGLSSSEVFCQIIADITGHTVNVAKNGISGAAAGAAKLAARGAGIEVAASAADQSQVRIHRPNKAVRDLYDAMFGVYQSVYRNVKSDFATLHQICADQKPTA